MLQSQQQQHQVGDGPHCVVLMMQIQMYMYSFVDRGHIVEKPITTLRFISFTTKAIIPSNVGCCKHRCNLTIRKRIWPLYQFRFSKWTEVD